jgi:adenylosuccinate lyase
LIERYTLPEMGNLWSEQAKFQGWLDVELAACQANAELGRLPEEALQQIREKASFEVWRILEIEAEVRHDVIAFLTNVNEHVGDAGRYIHVGMTSSDVVDTGLALQLKASVAVLRQELDRLGDALRQLARAHKDTVMIGRSHAIHGEPITFGFKVAGWLAETERNRERLARLEKVVSVGQISGAMGTYANTDPQVEAISCRILGLEPDTASTQVIGRDRHAEYVQTLALVGASLERFATEIRNLQRTDVLEVEESFAKGQKGSSAMPHKRNPIRSERISGLARVLRSYTVAALENCCSLARKGHQPQLRGAHDVAGLLRDPALHAAGDDRGGAGPGGLSRQHGSQYERVWRGGLQPTGAVGFGGKRYESRAGLSNRATPRPCRLEPGGWQLPRQPRG